MEGFQTYQYYKGNDVLRSWICIPLTVNIFDRKEETVRALFSPRLWTENGLLTQLVVKRFGTALLYMRFEVCMRVEKQKRLRNI